MDLKKNHLHPRQINKVFWILISIIILFGFITRIYIIHGNNLYFTADEGRDAVYVREIINSHTLFLKGPESSVRGLFTGPLWYYFIAIGYALMNGNPAGSVLVLTLLNLFITIVLMKTIKKEVDLKIALITGFALQIFWPFFNTSLYGFNPFPLVSLSVLLIIFLIKLLQTNNQKYYTLSLIPILFAFNTELAGASVFLIFYILVGFYLVLYKKLSRRNFYVFGLTIPLVGLIKIIRDFVIQNKATTNSGLNVFSATNFIQMGSQFVKMMGSIIPQQALIGFIIFILILLSFWRVKNKNKFTKLFVYLSLFLTLVSYLFFGSNLGWREWHTVYIPSLILITTLLICYELKNKTGKLLIVIILILNIFNFKQNYINYLKPSSDPSLLYNQERILDWIYSHNEENGFNLYTYTNSFYDYSYQYLISWYGKNTYGFFPCEYANFPLSHKYLYIPGSEKYNSPQLGCDKFRFLIIDSNTNGNENKEWINNFREQTVFVEKTQIGNTTIEKRRVPDKIK